MEKNSKTKDKKRIVFALGGSVVFPKEEKENVGKIKKIAEVFKELIKKGYEITIVVGGGKTAREYIHIAKEVGGNEFICDEIGIEATKMNCLLLIAALGKAAFKRIPSSFYEVENILYLGKIPVMGGTHPGHTTDTIAALLAEYLHADLLVIVTNVDGVYDKDPRKYSDAKKFERIHIEELLDLVKHGKSKAGSSFIVDLLACKIIERSKINTIIIKGEPEEIKRSIEGTHNGTIVYH